MKRIVNNLVITLATTISLLLSSELMYVYICEPIHLRVFIAQKGYTGSFDPIPTRTGGAGARTRNHEIATKRSKQEETLVQKFYRIPYRGNLPPIT